MLPLGLWTKGSNLEVEYNFEWSSRWESSRDIQVKPAPIVLTPKSRELLEDASRHLKQQERPNQVRQVIRGQVSDLHKIPGEFAKTARDKKKLVTIMWEPIPKQIQRVGVDFIGEVEGFTGDIKDERLFRAGAFITERAKAKWQKGWQI